MALGPAAQKSKDVILIFSFVLIYSKSPETADVIEMWFHSGHTRPVTVDQLQYCLCLCNSSFPNIIAHPPPPRAKTPLACAQKLWIAFNLAHHLPHFSGRSNKPAQWGTTYYCRDTTLAVWRTDRPGCRALCWASSKEHSFKGSHTLRETLSSELHFASRRLILLICKDPHIKTCSERSRKKTKSDLWKHHLVRMKCIKYLKGTKTWN